MILHGQVFRLKHFIEIKKRMVSALVMRLPDFSKIFEVTCDASGIGIGGVLAQEGHLVAYFSKKLNETKQRYSIYDRILCGNPSTSLLATLSATTRVCYLF